MTKDLLYFRAKTSALEIVEALMRGKPKKALAITKRTEREIKKAMGCAK